MANKIQLRRGTKAQLATLGALSAGEPGYTTDTKELFIGNGAGANTPLVTATSADITYYVRTDGNDSNNGLANTAVGAFKTIGKAISMIPQVVNHIVNINVSIGTYSDDIYLGGRSGSGSVNIKGAASLVATHVTSSIALLRNTCRVETTGFVFSKAGSNTIYSCPEVVFLSCTINSTFSGDGFLVDSAKVYFTGCSVSNRSPAFRAHANSEVLIQSCSGSGNIYAVTAAYGGKAMLDSNTITSTNKYSSYAGGTIMENYGVVNPWGDSTSLSRSFMTRGHIVLQTIPANVATKINFTSPGHDHLGESDSNGKFTAKSSGLYSFTFNVMTAAVPASNTIAYNIAVNGNLGQAVGKTTGTAQQFQGVGGTFLMKLNAGDYVELYAYFTGASATHPDPVGSYIGIIRVA